MKYIPKFDAKFKPAILEMQKFEKKLKENEANEIIICLERSKGYNYLYKMNIYKDGCGHDEENYEYVERIVKALLWMAGGYKIYIAGSDYVAKKLQADYSEKGKRSFDYFFMADVYEKPVIVVPCKKEEIPAEKTEKIQMSKGLKGCRIGFDAGGSDRKVSASVDGNVKYSEETVWFPKINSDPKYHFDGIMESLNEASKYMPTVDAVGVSTAGIVVDNKIMVASLFLKVSREDYAKHVKNIYIDCVKELEKKYNKKIPLVVANDGDVTALAGAMELDTNSGVLGIAMGTSEAAGYITPDGSLLGWLNELAFVPVDYNKEAMVDEWSGDYGCGVKYFSQDGIIKLAENAGVKFDSDWSPARKLKYVQDLIENGTPEEKELAEDIFLDLGTYLGYTIPYYAHFYDFKHMLLLGRVVSGKGGNLIVARARHVLEKDFPELSAKINIHMPDDKSRRVGQSIAAASLPIVE